jgi:hypothetical protein
VNSGRSFSRLLVDEIEQRDGVTNLIEPAPAREIVAAQLVKGFSDEPFPIKRDALLRIAIPADVERVTVSRSPAD